MKRPTPHPTRGDVEKEIERRYPPEQRKEVLDALDVYVSHDPTERARVQLIILARSSGDPAVVRELARHLLTESADVAAPPDPEALRNDRYAG